MGRWRRRPRMRRLRWRLPWQRAVPVVLGIALALGAMTVDHSRADTPITYHAGWNLVGAPEGTRYGGAEGPLYTLQPQDDAYEALPPGSRAVAGYGYWAYFPLARTVQLPVGGQFVTL